jgi:hypothetical protein
MYDAQENQNARLLIGALGRCSWLCMLFAFA